MATRKPPSKFALNRGLAIKEARKQLGLSQAELAKQLGKESRESVSQYETGKIEKIDVPTCRKFVRILGLEPEQLMEDPTMFENYSDDLPGISGQARRVARAWDGLPKGLQEFVWQQMTAFEQLKTAHPLLAQLAAGVPAKSLSPGDTKPPTSARKKGDDR